MYQVQVFKDGKFENLGSKKETMHEANTLALSHCSNSRVRVRGMMDSFIWDSINGVPQLQKNTVKKVRK